MRRLLLVAGLCLALVALASGVAAQEPDDPGRDPAVEKEILDRLALIDPAAVPIFTAATEAGDAGRLDEARRGYQEVLALAPDFPDALRRLATVEVFLGETASALAHAQRALALQPSAWNKGTLAFALASGDDPAGHRLALSLAQEAASEEPDDAFLATVLVTTAARNEEMATLEDATARLIDLAPWNPLGHYYGGLSAAYDRRWEVAERELLLSQRLGMLSEDVQTVLDAGIASQARLSRWTRRTAYAVIGWAAGLAALFFVGTTLSRATLAAVSRRDHAPDRPVHHRERWMRMVYRAVILLASLYFYLSMPILVVLVVAAFGGVIYAFLAIGTIPVQLVLFLVVGGLLTLLAILRSVTTRIGAGEPGRPLPRDEAPALWDLTDEVARRLKTLALEAIYVVPGTTIAVLERGGALARMRGKGRRSLVLGLGALAGMNRGQLKAILAHEYGHFSHRDTGGGDLALRVNVSLQRMGYGLAASGQARWYNPAWIFVNLFHRIFLRITLGASRLQEILADRMAAIAYGAEAFGSGLRHIIRQDVMFSAGASQEIEAAMAEGRALQNLYTLPPPSTAATDLETQFQQALERSTSPYDSHPAPRMRLELLEGIRGDPPGPFDHEPVSDLIPALEGLQQEMTSLIQQVMTSRVR